MPTFHASIPTATDRKSITSSPYTILASDDLIACNHSAALTLTLPAASAVSEGRKFTIKDESGNASTYNITINRAGSDTIDGETSVVISGNYDSIDIYRGGSGNWHVK